MWARPTCSGADCTLAGHSWLQWWSPHQGLTILQDGRPHPAEALLSDGMRRPREQQRQPPRPQPADWDGIQQGGAGGGTNGCGTSAGRTGWEDSSPKVGWIHDRILSLCKPHSGTLPDPVCASYGLPLQSRQSTMPATALHACSPSCLPLGAPARSELKEARRPSLGVLLQGVTAMQCKLAGCCLQAGAGGGGEDPGYDRPRGTAFGTARGGNPRREARPRRAAAEGAAPDPTTKPKVSNSEWTIARKLFYVQGKQVTSGSDALRAWRSCLLPTGWPPMAGQSAMCATVRALMWRHQVMRLVA